MWTHLQQTFSLTTFFFESTGVEKGLLERLQKEYWKLRSPEFKTKGFSIFIQYDRYKGANHIFKISQWSYHVQIWHTQWKQSELGSILSNFVVILNILTSREGWTFLKFFEVLKKKRGSIRSERQRESMEWDSEMTQKSLFLKRNLIYGNWNLHFHFITTFSANKIDPKVIGFFALPLWRFIINLTLLSLAFPNTHIIIC